MARSACTIWAERSAITVRCGARTGASAGIASGSLRVKAAAAQGGSRPPCAFTARRTWLISDVRARTRLSRALGLETATTVHGFRRRAHPRLLDHPARGVHHADLTPRVPDVDPDRLPHRRPRCATVRHAGLLPAWALADRAIDAWGAAAGDIQTSESHQASILAKLIVRLYAQASDDAQRKRALDAIDRMLEVGFYGLPDALKAADRV